MKDKNKMCLYILGKLFLTALKNFGRNNLKKNKL